MAEEGGINFTSFNKGNNLLSKMNGVEIGRVVSVLDEQGLGRIKVRIKGTAAKGGDDSTSNDDDLPWAFPMIPKFINTQPKVGEAVYVFVFSVDKQHADRMYLGPIISQPQKLFKDDYPFSLTGFDFGPQAPNVTINNIPELIGVFPKPEDISIQGRFNTEMTQKVNEVIIKAGKFSDSLTDKRINPFGIKFNKKTQGYLQIKNDAIIASATPSYPDVKGTIATLVANKINLITHLSPEPNLDSNGSPSFKVTGQDILITDEEMLKILKDAHQLPFGDILLEYLIAFKNAFLNHVHNKQGTAPPTDNTTTSNAVNDFTTKALDLEKRMLSKNIRIN